MPPLPKRKRSNPRNQKRLSHSAYRRPSLTRCGTCGSAKLPHIMCPVCGHYAGREIKSVRQAGGATEAE